MKVGMVRGDYTLHIASATAVWYKTGMPLVPIRWVLIQDPKGKFETQALLCTDLAATPRQILQWFRQRWQVEVSFEEVRTHLGLRPNVSGPPWRLSAPHPFSLVVLNCHNPCTSTALASSFRPAKVAWYHLGNRLSPMHSRLATSTALADADFSDVLQHQTLLKFP